MYAFTRKEEPAVASAVVDWAEPLEDQSCSRENTSENSAGAVRTGSFAAERSSIDVFSVSVTTSSVRTTASALAVSRDGRIGRRFYWTMVVLTSLGAAAVSLGPTSSLYGPAAALVVWILLGRARMRDIGRSPLWLNVPWVVALMTMVLLMKFGLALAPNLEVFIDRERQIFQNIKSDAARGPSGQVS